MTVFKIWTSKSIKKYLNLRLKWTFFWILCYFILIYSKKPKLIFLKTKTSYKYSRFFLNFFFYKMFPDFEKYWEFFAFTFYQSVFYHKLSTKLKIEAFSLFRNVICDTYLMIIWIHTVLKLYLKYWTDWINCSESFLWGHRLPSSNLFRR